MNKPEHNTSQPFFTWENIKTIIYILSAIESTYLLMYFLFVLLPVSIICFLVSYFADAFPFALAIILQSLWFYIPAAFVIIYTICYFAAGKHKKDIEDIKKERFKHD